MRYYKTDVYKPKIKDFLNIKEFDPIHFYFGGGLRGFTFLSLGFDGSMGKSLFGIIRWDGKQYCGIKMGVFFFSIDIGFEKNQEKQ